MPPLNNITCWDRRDAEGMKPLNPKSTCWVLCEGETEKYYFQALFEMFEQRKLPKTIMPLLLEKTGEDKGRSNPRALKELAEMKMNSTDYCESDEFIVVFDTDIYRDDPKTYSSLLREFNDLGIRVAVTFPCFELWLLLHLDQAMEKHVMPHKEEIIGNKKSGKTRFISKYFSSVTKINSKRNKRVGELARFFSRACKCEKEINQDPDNAIGILTSNIGKVFEPVLMER